MTEWIDNAPQGMDVRAWLDEEGDLWKRCVVCNDWFPCADIKRRKYCSDNCRQRAHYERKLAREARQRAREEPEVTTEEL
jgi:predicted nucleic acid-binding Zn ribbon protein